MGALPAVALAAVAVALIVTGSSPHPDADMSARTRRPA
jgi:hypothetical protein